MRHLSESVLLDLAEGTRADGADDRAHLDACATCRSQLNTLRSMLVLAGGGAGEVPEPSPMYWDRLSARVQEKIAREHQWSAGRPRLGRWLVPLAAGVSVVIAAILWNARLPDAPQPAASATQATFEAGDSVPLVPLGDDPSLSLLAAMTEELEWDSMVEAGLTPEAGAVDRVVAALDADEREALHRLLQEALSQQGV